MSIFRILITFVLFLSIAMPAQGGERLTVMSSDWPPFASGRTENPGFFAEVVRDAFALSGIEVRFQFEPWARCMLAVEFGECFGAIPLAKTAEREAFGIYSRPVFMTRNPVIFNRNRIPGFDYTGLDCLRGYKLGGLLGWFYLKDWEQAKLKYHCLSDQHTAFRMIDAGRIDLTIFDEFAGKHLLRQRPEFKDSIEFSATPYSTKELYLLASRKYPESERLVRLFNENLGKLRENGSLDRLAAKYDLPPELFLH